MGRGPGRVPRFRRAQSPIDRHRGQEDVAPRAPLADEAALGFGWRTPPVGSWNTARRIGMDEGRPGKPTRGKVGCQTPERSVGTRSRAGASRESPGGRIDDRDGRLGLYPVLSGVHPVLSGVHPILVGMDGGALRLDSWRAREDHPRPHEHADLYELAGHETPPLIVCQGPSRAESSGRRNSHLEVTTTRWWERSIPPREAPSDDVPPCGQVMLGPI